MTDPYQVLGVSPTASDDEVKKAYRTLCKKYHPDANVGKPDAAQAEKKFMEVQQAYEEIMAAISTANIDHVKNVAAALNARAAAAAGQTEIVDD